MEMNCVGLALGIALLKCTTAEAPPAQTFCQIAEPQTWSAKDTRRTKEQVDRHNRVGKKLCGWGARP